LVQVTINNDADRVGRSASRRLKRNRLFRGSVAVSVHQDAARLGEALPRLTVALRAEARGDHYVFRLEPAAAALELEDSHTVGGAAERVVRRKMTF
jgi:hypothetical protein